MAIYIFDQTIKRMGDSIDDIKKYRGQMLEKTSAPIKYIFTKIPEQKDIRKYRKAGMAAEQLISVHQYFTDNHTLERFVKTEDKLQELKNSLQYTNVNRMDTEIRLGKGGYVIASILLDEEDKTYCRGICYFSYMKLLRQEIYTNSVAYVDYYITAESGNGLYAKKTRRAFYNMDGSVAYEQIFEEEKECFLLPDGNVFTRQQFATEFVKKLNLSKQDIILLDNSVPEEFRQAIFMFGKVARIVALAHMGQERIQGENAESLPLKGYYYEWFPYSEILDTIIVSTESQKDVLREELETCCCNVPDIKVAPIDGTFISVTLYESYGGNLALSWNYKGKTDGFLIYDENGIQIYETNDIHQHYFLIKKYGKEKGFIIKAFVHTLKGKCVIAESDLIYLSIRPYEKPLVSLIIPAYNAEDYIARAVDNALAQSFSDLEIIVVDDGSKDNTAGIIDWYAEKYPNVLVIHKENGGAAVARNTGIEAANGEYIEFMDSDDMIHMDMVEKLYNAIRKNNCDVAITSAYQLLENGCKVFIRYPMEEDMAIEVEDFFYKYYIREAGYGTVVWNKLYDASLVKKHLFISLPAEDEAWTPYVLSYADRICYLNEYLYEYDRTVRDNTLIDKVKIDFGNEMFAICKNRIMFYLKNGNPKKLKILKALAKKQLLGAKRQRMSDESKILWEEIEEIFPND